MSTGLRITIGLLLGTSLASAQAPARTSPSDAQIYCSGIVTDKPFPTGSYLISGEDSSYKTTFSMGDTVFINHGMDQGIQVGQLFEVVRPVQDLVRAVVWFKYQTMLSRAMGSPYADIGRLRIIHVDSKTSTAEIALGCNMMQRGDLVLPFAARPAPQFHDIKLDPFAAPSGKKTAMVVSTKDFGVMAGAGSVVYINLGSAQGVQVGDYFRVFRYQGTRIESIYQLENTAYKIYGFGSTPVSYSWNNLPRQVMGEGIVLRTGPNSSTVLLTTVRDAVYAGDYAEVE